MQLSFLPHQGEINPPCPPLLHARTSATKIRFSQTLSICWLGVPKGKKSQFPRQCRDKLPLSNSFSESRAWTAIRALPPSHRPSLPAIPSSPSPRVPPEPRAGPTWCPATLPLAPTEHCSPRPHRAERWMELSGLAGSCCCPSSRRSLGCWSDLQFAFHLKSLTPSRPERHSISKYLGAVLIPCQDSGHNLFPGCWEQGHAPERNQDMGGQHGQFCSETSGWMWCKEVLNYIFLLTKYTPKPCPEVSCIPTHSCSCQIPAGDPRGLHFGREGENLWQHFFPYLTKPLGNWRGWKLLLAEEIIRSESAHWEGAPKTPSPILAARKPQPALAWPCLSLGTHVPPCFDHRGVPGDGVLWSSSRCLCKSMGKKLSLLCPHGPLGFQLSAHQP